MSSFITTTWMETQKLLHQMRPGQKVSFALGEGRWIEAVKGQQELFTVSLTFDGSNRDAVELPPLPRGPWTAGRLAIWFGDRPHRITATRS